MHKYDIISTTFQIIINALNLRDIHNSYINICEQTFI
jgi:hypothetical protein